MSSQKIKKILIALWLQTFIFLGVSQGLMRSGLIRDEGLYLLISAICAVLPLVLWGRGVEDYLEEIRRSRWISLKVILLLFLCCVALNFLGAMVTLPIETLLKALGWTAKNSNMEDLIVQNTPMFVVYSCIIGPAIEEIIYRGGVQHLLEPYGAKRAVIFSAILFGFMHHDLYQAIAAAGCGLVFGYAKYHYGLRNAIILHVLNNIFVTCSELYRSMAPVIAILALLGIILLVVLGVRKKLTWEGGLSVDPPAVSFSYVGVPLGLLLLYEFVFSVVTSVHPL